MPRTAISRWADVDGPVHWLDYGGPADGPLIVCAHGLGGSALNWAAIAPELAETNRVVAIDLAGFGRTRGGAHSTTVQSNQRLLHRFLTEYVGSPAILIGNSMGGLISILQASKRPDTVAGLVLVDPALPLPAWPPPDPRVFAAFASFLVPAVGRRVLSRRRESGRRRTPCTRCSTCAARMRRECRLTSWPPTSTSPRSVASTSTWTPSS